MDYLTEIKIKIEPEPAKSLLFETLCETNVSLTEDDSDLSEVSINKNHEPDCDVGDESYLKIKEELESDSHISETLCEPDVIIQEEPLEAQGGWQVFVKEESSSHDDYEMEVNSKAVITNIKDETPSEKEDYHQKQLFSLQNDIFHQEQIFDDSSILLETMPCSSTLFENWSSASEDVGLNVKPSESKKDKPKKMHQCSICDYKTVWNNSLRRHLQNHSDTKLFKCSQCSYETNRRTRLKTHLLNHSDTKLYQCTFCSYEANDKRNYINHLLSHSNIKLFKCTECSYETNRQCNLKAHMLNHSDTKLYKCTICNFETNRKSSLRTHIQNHSDIKLFKCNFCSYEAKRKSHLQSHLLKHSDTKLFKCTQCKYETNHKRDLKVHLLNHLDAKLFKCQECNFETSDKRVLRSHALTHSVLKLFKCAQCKYETNFKSHLQRHSLTHLDQKLFKCSECDYETNEKSKLKAHTLRKHSQPSPRNSNILDIPTNTKFLKCSKCSYETNIKSHLQRHLLRHMDKKLFKCTECEFESNEKCKLKVHMMRKHGKIESEISNDFFDQTIDNRSDQLIPREFSLNEDNSKIRFDQEMVSNSVLNNKMYTAEEIENSDCIVEIRNRRNFSDQERYSNETDVVRINKNFSHDIDNIKCSDHRVKPYLDNS